MVQVVSYIRFSSLKQALGNSLQRQVAMSEAWCTQHGYVLDDKLKFRDLGVSAWSGKNVDTGAFSCIMQLARDGTIKPGSILILEALDRLSRQDLTLSIPLLIGVLELGINLVTLHDGKMWTHETLKSLPDFIGAVLALERGHNESAHKSRRVRDAYAAQREAKSNVAFGTAPGWLIRADKHSSWQVIPGKRDVVIKVFELAASGYGSPAIAKVANKEGWILPVRVTSSTKTTWHSRLPGYILRNQAVLGRHEYRIRTHEAHAKSWDGQSTGIIVDDFYPRIISDDLWHRAQAGISSRHIPRRRDEHFFNIWSGLLYCGYCGSAMQRKIEHRGYSRGQIICSNKLSGATHGCRPASVKLTDPTLLREITLFAAGAIGMQKQAGDDAALLLETAQGRLLAIDAASDRLSAAIMAADGQIPAFNRQAAELSAQRVDLLKKIDELKQKIAAFEPDFLDDSYARSVVASLYEKSDSAKALRADCNARLLRAVKRIYLWPYDVALVEYLDIPVRQGIPLPVKKLGDHNILFQQHLLGNLQLPKLD